MRMSDWSSDVCSSDLITPGGRPGPLLASADMLIATIKGRGGHAAMPHDCVDPIPVACEIVTALQTFIARQVRSEERRVGKECVCTCMSRWSPCYLKKKKS